MTHSTCDTCGADQVSVIPDGDGGRRCWGCDGADGEERTMAIKRYEPATEYIGTGDYVAGMEHDSEGDYVTFDDHRAALDTERARAERAEAERDAERVEAELKHAALVSSWAERDALRVRADGAELLYRDAAGQVDALRAEVERLTKERDELLESGLRFKREADALREKSIRFDLDAAGIEQREREAVELVELRADLARVERELGIERMAHVDTVRSHAREAHVTGRLRAAAERIVEEYDRNAALYDRDIEPLRSALAGDAKEVRDGDV